MDGTILAAAGLKRLGLELPGRYFSVEEMIPAAGQGILAVQIRKGGKITAHVRNVGMRQTALCSQ